MSTRSSSNGQSVPLAVAEASYVLEPRTRQAWARANAATISRLLDSPALSAVPRRVWRLRYWCDDEYIVATIVQNQGAVLPDGARVSVNAMRGYAHGAVGLRLRDDFSVDDIVAFLRLDCVEPDTVDWTDETRYSTLEIPFGKAIDTFARVTD